MELSNGRVDVVLVPQLGGRIIQLRLGDFEYLWVNPELAGQEVQYDRSGQLNPEPLEWANYGGDKLWPAPQGWSGPEEWPGPPDPVAKGGRTDHGPFQYEVISSEPTGVAVRLTGPEDLYAGIRFVREIRLLLDSTTVELKSTMVNVTDRTVRWGIWQVTQHAALAGVEDDLEAWAPINPRSKYPRGFKVLFGPEENPQFQVEGIPQKASIRKLFRLKYRHSVGKAGLDSTAGWLAVTHQKSGHLFAHTFPVKPDMRHPDGASVEFWASGPGWVKLGGQNVKLEENEPWLIESEVLSPYARLEPGKSYTFTSTIHLTRGRGPVVDVGGNAVVLKSIRQERGSFSGRIAFSRDGTLELRGLSAEALPPVVLGTVEAGSVVDLEEKPWIDLLQASREVIVGAGVAFLQLKASDGRTLASFPINKAEN